MPFQNQLSLTQWSQHVIFGTHRIVQQQKLMRVCAYASSRQRRRCLHTQLSIEVDEDPDQSQSELPRPIPQNQTTDVYIEDLL